MLAFMTGTVSGLQQSSETRGSVTTTNGRVTGQTVTMQNYNFRVDGKPVSYRSLESLSLNDGDQVKVAGQQKASGFQALAFRNLTTGTLHKPASWMPWIVVGACVLVALLSLLLVFSGAAVIGVVLLAASGGGAYWMAKMTLDIEGAVKELQAQA